MLLELTKDCWINPYKINYMYKVNGKHTWWVYFDNDSLEISEDDAQKLVIRINDFTSEYGPFHMRNCL